MNDLITTARGEFTSDGKLWHLSGSVEGANQVAHEGAWLNCDGCNPVRHLHIVSGVLSEREQEMADLRAEYAAAKQQETEVKERVKLATDKLKAALNDASGGALRSSLHVPGYKPVNLVYSEPWRLDSKRLKEEDPSTWVAYATQGEQWTLSESRGRS